MPLRQLLLNNGIDIESELKLINPSQKSPYRVADLLRLVKKRGIETYVEAKLINLWGKDFKNPQIVLLYLSGVSLKLFQIEYNTWSG